MNGLGRTGTITIIGALIAAVALFTIGRTSSICLTDCLSIQALEVSTEVTSRSEWARGKYRLVKSDPFNGILSNGNGGACLVFRSPLNQSYKTYTDCAWPDPMTDSAIHQIVRPEFAGSFRYCSPEKTCWIKLSHEHCRKSSDEYPPKLLTVDQDNLTPGADLFFVRMGLFGLDQGPRRIDARVIACLNGSGAKAPCAVGPPANRIIDYGKPQSIAVPRGHL